MVKHKKIKKKKTPKIFISFRKIKGERREVIVKRISKGKYRVRLKNPKTKHSTQTPKSGAGHFNYKNKGDSWGKDRSHYNKKESWERAYRKKKGGLGFL